MRMINNYLACEDIQEEQQNTSGFITNTEERMKSVKVIQSSEEDIPVGSIIKIPSNAGLVDNIGLVIRRGDVICIL